MADEVVKRRHLGRVTEDVAGADSSGVSGTPTFFVNGRRHQGVYDIEGLTRSIRRAKVLAAADSGEKALPG